MPSTWGPIYNNAELLNIKCIKPMCRKLKVTSLHH